MPPTGCEDRDGRFCELSRFVIRTVSITLMTSANGGAPSRTKLSSYLIDPNLPKFA